jgi:hypothetical protein
MAARHWLDFFAHTVEPLLAAAKRRVNVSRSEQRLYSSVLVYNM